MWIGTRPVLSHRPALLDLTGLTDEDAYTKARDEFARILLANPIIDPRSLCITFDFNVNHAAAHDDCWHACFKQSPGARDPWKKQPRDTFRRDRAERIPWILETLTNKDETRIRRCPVPGDPDRDSYTLWMPGQTAKDAQEPFGVFVRKLDNRRERAFITGYTMDAATAQKVKDSGPLLYPAPKTKAKKGK